MDKSSIYSQMAVILAKMTWPTMISLASLFVWEVQKISLIEWVRSDQRSVSSHP